MGNVTSYKFTNCSNLTTISATKGMKISGDNIEDLFRSSGLTAIPSNTFEYLSHVTDADGIFYQCQSLSMVLDDVLFSKMSSVTTLRDCFRKCKLTSIHQDALQGLSSIQNIFSLFEFNETLTEIPSGLLDNLNTLTNISELIANCGSFTNIPDNLFTPTHHPNLQSAVRVFENVTLSNSIYEVWSLDWSSTPFVPTGTLPSFNCTNSADIPSSWK